MKTLLTLCIGFGMGYAVQIPLVREQLSKLYRLIRSKLSRS